MPLPPQSVNYQIVPIRHSNSFYRVPAKSLTSLNTFGRNYNYNNNNNSDIDSGTMRNTDERRSPYYYNELTRMHANNFQQHFMPISNGDINDDSFTDFINTIHHPEPIS